MNILLVTKHLDIGGIAWYTVNLARFLKKSGVEVMVASSGGELEKELKRFNIEHIKIVLPGKNEFNPLLVFSVIKLCRIVRKRKIDIIHAQTRVTQVASYFSAKVTGVKYVSTCHGFYKIRYWRKVFPFWGKFVIAVSDFCKERFLNILKVYPDKIRVVYNGIDLERFKEPPSAGDKAFLRRKFGLKEDSFVIGNISRLSPAKKTDNLIRVFAMVCAHFPNTELFIVGDGPEKANLLRLVEEFSLTDKVKIIDGVNSTSNALSVMDLFVSCTEFESFGLAIVEAMASRLAVVASNVGGIPCVVEEGLTGILAEFSDLNDFVEKIGKLIKDERLRLAFAERAREIAFAKFGLERMAEETKQVYLEALR